MNERSEEQNSHGNYIQIVPMVCVFTNKFKSFYVHATSHLFCIFFCSKIYILLKSKKVSSIIILILLSFKNEKKH